MLSWLSCSLYTFMCSDARHSGAACVRFRAGFLRSPLWRCVLFVCVGRSRDRSYTFVVFRYCSKVRSCSLFSGRKSFVFRGVWCVLIYARHKQLRNNLPAFAVPLWGNCVKTQRGVTSLHDFQV